MEVVPEALQEVHPKVIPTGIGIATGIGTRRATVNTTGSSRG